MIGCQCTSTNDSIEIKDKEELEDAKWFPIDTIRRALKGDKGADLILPSPYAIAHQVSCVSKYTFMYIYILQLTSMGVYSL
jgi:NADH pyrophosphatase NudC (nudix superfamily)